MKTKKKNRKRKDERGSKREWDEECEFCVARLLQMKSAVLFSVVVEPRESYVRK